MNRGYPLHHSGLPASALLAALLAMPAAGLAAIDADIRAGGEPVEVSVRVTDDHGAPLYGLTEVDFELVEGGQPVTIDGFRVPAAASPEDGISLSIVFALDYSISIENEDAIVPVEEAVVGFIEDMSLGDYAAILKFDGAISDYLDGFVQVDPADTRALAEAVRADPAPVRGSLVFDTALQALDLLQANAGQLPQGPKAVVLLTDGEDRGSRTTLAELVERLREASVAVFPVAFGAPDAATMTTIAGASGTEYIAGSDSGAFELIADELHARLRNEYLLQYTSRVATGDCTTTPLALAVQPGLPNEQRVDTSFSRCPVDNVAPSIASIPTQYFRLGEAAELRVDANDPDGGTVRFTATGLPPGLTIDAASGVIGGTPTRPGVYATKVTASDEQLSSNAAFSSVVVDASSGGGGALGVPVLLLGALAGLAVRRRVRGISAG